MKSLYWLPKHPSFNEALKDYKRLAADTGDSQWARLRSLAQCRLDFLEIGLLDRQLQTFLATPGATGQGLALRLAVLSSSTVDHLLSSIRVAALRRNIRLSIYTAPYNQSRQEILNPNSEMYAFKPDVVLLHYDHRQLPLSAPEDAVGAWADLWKQIQNRTQASVIHQTVFNPSLQVLGELDAQRPDSVMSQIDRVNDALRNAAKDAHVTLLDADAWSGRVGKSVWHDASLWLHAKQEISPACAPLYGDLVARQLAAIKGRSSKCLILDLDNTLWGGVVGDDGLANLRLGEGSAEGESFSAFQRYVLQLRKAGVILAVCSKNDERIALDVFHSHREMLLRHSDFAVFIANWNDKAANLREIARQLNIGLDALVFVDDHPAERSLIRQTLPEVSVPELPEDAAFYPQCLSDAGYFESISFTADDALRGDQYTANARRQEALQSSTDLTTFLQSLDMQLEVRPFVENDIPRITQLINKTNQFNLTTPRYNESQVRQFMADSAVISLSARLRDSFGDNGLISVIIARPIETARELVIDTWLMSCRVLGRQVEEELLNQLVLSASQRGITALRGHYHPTEKNRLVENLYPRLGFSRQDTCWRLALATFKPIKTFIRTQTMQAPASSGSLS